MEIQTYKFRSNLYQHKCPDRQKQLSHGNRRRGGLAISPSTRRLESNQLLKSRIDANAISEDLVTYQISLSDSEDNDLPITYGLVIHKLEEAPQKVRPDTTVKQRKVESSFASDLRSFFQQSEAAEEPNSVVDNPTFLQKRRTDCVRDQPLPQEEIDAYIARNKSKVWSTLH
ncbi:hypothetical protein OSTOST_00060, partial [Ostertagia ostertagi]